MQSGLHASRFTGGVQIRIGLPHSQIYAIHISQRTDRTSMNEVMKNRRSESYEKKNELLSRLK